MDLPVFKNKRKETLIYYPVPKNANTSIKSIFASIMGIEDKFEYREDIPRFKRDETEIILSGGKPSIAGFFKNYQEFVPVNVNYKICIIRDPIDRFISAYENRILFHKDRKFYEYSVEKVLHELSNGNFRNRHFLPQTFFLGKNLNYFSHIFKLNQLDQLCKTLESFFSVDKIKIPHLQTGRNKKIELTKYQIEKIQTIYRKDYILLDKFL